MHTLHRFFLMLVLLVITPLLFAEENSAIFYTEEKPVVMVSAEQPEFTLKLKSNPTTGYRWLLVDYNADLLHPISHVDEAPPNKKIVGAPGYELWTFHVKKSAFQVPMQTHIRLVYARPWENNNNVKNINFIVNTGL